MYFNVSAKKKLSSSPFRLPAVSSLLTSLMAENPCGPRAYLFSAWSISYAYWRYFGTPV